MLSLHRFDPWSGSVGKESACNAGDPSSIPGLGRSPGEGIGYPLQYSWASLVPQLLKNPPAMWETWVGKIPWRRKRLPTPVFLGFPCASAVKESTCNAEDLGLIPGLGRSPGERKGYPLQYSGRENSMDCIVHEVAKSQTQLSDFHFLSGNKIMNATWHSQNNTKKDILGDARRLWR